MRRSRPRIALNAQLLEVSADYRSAGIARYIHNLLRALPATTPGLMLDVFTHESRARGISNTLHLHRTRLPTRSPLVRVLWEQLIFPILLLGGQYDLVHSLAYVSPMLSVTTSVVTVYDLSFLVFPEYFHTLNRIYLKWGTHASARLARRVIAISESTRHDLVQLLGVPEEKIEVIPPGVESEFFPNGDSSVVDKFRRSKNLPDRMILFVGTREPRKNIPTLIRAFAQVKSRSKLPHKLALVGGQGWKDESITRALEECGVAGEVVLPGYVPNDELPYWYRAADAFVYPSRYEGFGLPVLEAMASGTPVVTSRLSSLPEAAGDAALLVDPADEEELEDAIVRVVEDRELANELSAKGTERARQFTWTRAAQATADVYRRALS